MSLWVSRPPRSETWGPLALWDAGIPRRVGRHSWAVFTDRWLNVPCVPYALENRAKPHTRNLLRKQREIKANLWSKPGFVRDQPAGVRFGRAVLPARRRHSQSSTNHSVACSKGRGTSKRLIPIRGREMGLAEGIVWTRPLRRRLEEGWGGGVSRGSWSFRHTEVLTQVWCLELRVQCTPAVEYRGETRMNRGLTSLDSPPRLWLDVCCHAGNQISWQVAC